MQLLEQVREYQAEAEAKHKADDEAEERRPKHAILCASKAEFYSVRDSLLDMGWLGSHRGNHSTLSRLRELVFVFDTSLPSWPCEMRGYRFDTWEATECVSDEARGMMAAHMRMV